MARDLKLDSNRDLALESGDLAFVDDGAEVAQAVGIRLRFFLGEWFLDNRLGVDYYGTVYVKDPDLTAIEALFRRTIMETPGMGPLTEYTQELATATRTLTVSWRGTTDDGTAIEGAEVIGL